MFGRITFNPDVMEGQPCVLGLTVVSIIRLRLDPDWGDERIRADGVGVRERWSKTAPLIHFAFSVTKF